MFFVAVTLIFMSGKSLFMTFVLVLTPTEEFKDARLYSKKLFAFLSFLIILSLVGSFVLNHQLKTYNVVPEHEEIIVARRNEMNTVKRLLSVNVFQLQKKGFDKHIIPISKRQKGLQKVDYQKEFK